MSRVVRNLLSRVTSPPHAGRGEGNTPELLEDPDIVPPTPVRKVGEKSKVQDRSDSPTEIPAPKRQTTGNLPSPSAPSLPASGELNMDMVSLINGLRLDLRSDLSNVVADGLAPVHENLQNMTNLLRKQARDIDILMKRVDSLERENTGLRREVSEWRQDGGKPAILDRMSRLEVHMRNQPHNQTEPGLNRETVNGTTQDLVEELLNQKGRENNVLLHGVAECQGEDLPSLARTLVPSNTLIQEVLRIGRPREDTNVRPRPVLIKTNKSGKASLLRNKMTLRHNGQPIYVSHDLTPSQQARRRQVLPTFKQLRGLGTACSLPYDKILVQGKPLDDAELARLLQDKPAQ